MTTEAAIAAQFLANLTALHEFAAIIDIADEDFIFDPAGQYPVAAFGLLEETGDSQEEWLVIDKTYQVIVAQRKGIATASHRIHVLCDLVRDTFNGSNLSITTLAPLRYVGRELVQFEGPVIIYTLKFTTRDAE